MYGIDGTGHAPSLSCLVMKNCNNELLIIYANLTALLANIHIDSGYLVVVTKEGSD